MLKRRGKILRFHVVDGESDHAVAGLDVLPSDLGFCLIGRHVFGVYGAQPLNISFGLELAVEWSWEKGKSLIEPQRLSVDLPEEVEPLFCAHKKRSTNCTTLRENRA